MLPGMSRKPLASDAFGIPHPRRIRAVAFDAVGTLIHPRPSVADIYARIGRRHGSRRTRDEVARRFRDAFVYAETEAPSSPAEWDRPDRLRCDEAGERSRWRTIVTTVLDDADDPLACFEELFAHFARPDAWAAFPDVADSLADLRRMGFVTAVASNFDSRLLGLCRDIPALSDVAVRVVSSQAGYRKPSRKFYGALAAACGVAADAVLMVGDDWANDVLGARHAGLQAVYLSRDEPAETPRDRREPAAIRTLRTLPELLADRRA